MLPAAAGVCFVEKKEKKKKEEGVSVEKDPSTADYFLCERSTQACSFWPWHNQS